MMIKIKVKDGAGGYKTQELKCTHSKRREVGTIPEAKFPVPLSELPSEISKDILSGALVIPGGPKYIPETEHLPARAIMRCTNCGHDKLMPVTKLRRV